MQFSLQKRFILSKKSDIRNLFAKGNWKKGRYYSVLFHPGEELKFLFTSSKNTKNAVSRNKKKRYSREIVRQMKLSLPSGHYAFILQHIPHTKSLERLQNDLSFLLNKKDMTPY